jgi:hypothetical protein
MADICDHSKSSFALFPKIPLEVREMVWIEALPHRVISISEKLYGPRFENSGNNVAMVQNYRKPEFWQFKSSAKTPSIFHACQESRRVALKIYHLSFGGYGLTAFYFNPSIDTIFFNSIGALNGFLSKAFWPSFVGDMKKIRYLALGSTIHTSLSMSLMLGQLFGKFENVESLVIQTGQNFGTLEKFQVRKQLRGHWKKSEAEGGSSDGKIVMQNPDIVFLDAEEMRLMGLVSS